MVELGIFGGGLGWRESLFSFRVFRTFLRFSGVGSSIYRFGSGGCLDRSVSLVGIVVDFDIEVLGVFIELGVMGMVESMVLVYKVF